MKGFFVGQLRTRLVCVVGARFVGGTLQEHAHGCVWCMWVRAWMVRALCVSVCWCSLLGCGRTGPHLFVVGCVVVFSGCCLFVCE